MLQVVSLMTEIGEKKLWICNEENGDYSWKPVDGLYIIILDTVCVEIEMDRKHITKKCMCINTYALPTVTIDLIRTK